MELRGDVLVFLEAAEGGGVLPRSLEAVTAGQRLAAALGGRPVGLVVGDRVGDVAGEAAHYGLEEVLLVDHPALARYLPEVHLAAFLAACERLKPAVILMADTFTSLDLAPRLAFALDTGLVADCVGVEIEGGEPLFVKPVFSSNVMAAYGFHTSPGIVTLRARVEEPAARRDAEEAPVNRVEVDLGTVSSPAEILEDVVVEEEGPRLADAAIVVSGGRGMGGPEGFERLAAVAEVLGAALGASRPPCDLGWAPPRAQVGQTGEKVAPSLYIAVGISGATQHLAGMQGSNKIVAVNKDPKANIFRVADYGVVGTWEEVLPAFHEEIIERLKGGGVP